MAQNRYGTFAEDDEYRDYLRRLNEAEDYERWNQLINGFTTFQQCGKLANALLQSVHDRPFYVEETWRRNHFMHIAMMIIGKVQSKPPLESQDKIKDLVNGLVSFPYDLVPRPANVQPLPDISWDPSAAARKQALTSSLVRDDIYNKYDERLKNIAKYDLKSWQELIDGLSTAHERKQLVMAIGLAIHERPLYIDESWRTKMMHTITVMMYRHLHSIPQPPTQEGLEEWKYLMGCLDTLSFNEYPREAGVPLLPVPRQ